MVFAKTPFTLKQAMPEALDYADANLTARMRNLVGLLWSERKDLEQQFVAMNEEVEQISAHILRTFFDRPRGHHVSFSPPQH